MCGRFTLTEFTGVYERWGVEIESLNLSPRYNIAPSQDVAVIVANGQNQFELEFFRWGLIPHWAKETAIGQKTINARAESVAEKPSFKGSFERKRCGILADGFYEWKKEGSAKRPYRFMLKTKEPFLFAGLWDTWISPKGETINSCTIITTEANELMAPIHHRMPVILTRDFEAVWLSPKVTEAHVLRGGLKPFPADEMIAYEVDERVNSPKNDGAYCIEPRMSLF